MSWRKVFRAKVVEGNDSTRLTSTTEESIKWTDLPSIFFSLTCQMIVCGIAVDIMITATGNLVTLVPSPSAEYCTLFRVRGCRVREQMGCTKDRKQLVWTSHFHACLDVFCSVVLYFVFLFWSVLFYCFILFCFILFSCILFRSIFIQFYSVLFYLFHFYSTLLFYSNSILFCCNLIVIPVLFYSVLIHCVRILFSFILFYSILILFILYYSILFYSILIPSYSVAIKF